MGERDRKTDRDRQAETNPATDALRHMQRQRQRHTDRRTADHRSITRLSRTIRSIATRTHWSGPIKSRIVNKFLPSRTTESDGGSGPLGRGAGGRGGRQTETDRWTDRRTQAAEAETETGRQADGIGKRRQRHEERERQREKTD